MKFDQRQRELQAAIDAEIATSGVSGIQRAYGSSIRQTQSLLVHLDDEGTPVGLAVPLKWASCKVTDFHDYNAIRQKLHGPDLIDPKEFGTLLPMQHPAYAHVKADYQRYGLSLPQNFRLYALTPSAAPALGQDLPEADATRWDRLVEHLVGAVRALPAPQRAVIMHRLAA